tara:strand:+ start:1969 stop:2481 length:513 start_codon:yes stop_codon:yes gene_type:complete
MKKNNGKGRVMYGISRIDDDVHRTHAWRVSLSRRGKRYVKNFADKKCGGKTKALASAKQHRDQLLKDIPPLSRKEFCTILRSNNKSGISGVCKYGKPFVLKDGTIKKNWYWEATWPTGKGKQANVTFSINDYGDERARELAIIARRQAMRRIKGYFWASERALEPAGRAK